MAGGDEYETRSVPARALALSVSALLVPVTGALAFPDALGEAGALLWLLALVPAFLLAYYRGWRGVATALALGMATLSLTQVAATVLDRAIPEILFAIVVAYLGISVGIGWVTELLHRQRADVEDLALTDILTRLPNRRHARIFLENEFGAAERGRALAVVLFDLDEFKKYNDDYGHQAGDEALQRFGEILVATTRKMNLSARFGGEEFLSILAGSDDDGAMIFAERVRESLANAHLTHGRLTVSAGIAAYHPSMRSPDELIAAADLALYRAKRDGRNCSRIFGRAMEVAIPDEEAESEEVLATLRGEVPPNEYPRSSDAIGRSRPPVTLLPHQITGFGEGRRVLLVEDERPVRNLISSYLNRENFEVVEAEDAPAAARALGEEFDVVITDIRLPGASGNELVTTVKSRWPRTQALVITGYRDAGVAARALKAGADAYLFKPFGMPELQTHLKEALARRDHEVSERFDRLGLTEGANDRAEGVWEAVRNGAMALVEAVEIRDPYTRGHSGRVAELALRLAAHLPEGMGDWSRDALRLGCQVHDVGKIGVPDAILNKPDTLSEEEFALVRTHPRTSRRILEPLIGDEVVLGIATWHHERWDGEGYPDGLIGEAIPVPARVVAVADALEAMTSARAYRSRLDWDEAVEVIRSRFETHFDPALETPFEAALPELRAICLEPRPPHLAEPSPAKPRAEG